MRSTFFQKALDAVGPEIPDAEFRVGQVIAAYTDSSHGMLIAYGRVESLEWNNSFNQWFYELTTVTESVTAPAYRLRAISPEEQRMLWTTIEGGF